MTPNRRMQRTVQQRRFAPLLGQPLTLDVGPLRFISRNCGDCALTAERRPSARDRGVITGESSFVPFA